MTATVEPVVETPEVAEITVGQEMVEIPEEVEVPIAPEPVAVDSSRPLRRKKT